MWPSKFKIGGFHEEIPIQFIYKSELLACLKPLFTISRFFGIPNFLIVDSTTTSRPLWLSLHNFLSLFFILNQIFLIARLTLNSQDFLKDSLPQVIMKLHVICTHLWSIFYSNQLSKALSNIPSLENRLNKVYNDDNSNKTKTIFKNFPLRRTCFVLILVYVLVVIGLTSKDIIGDSITVGGYKVWTKYGENHCSIRRDTLLHPVITTTYCLLSELATNFVWLFGDFLVLLLSPCLTTLFKMINERGIKPIHTSRLNVLEIDLVREHHGAASKSVNVSEASFFNILFN